MDANLPGVHIKKRFYFLFSFIDSVCLADGGCLMMLQLPGVSKKRPEKDFISQSRGKGQRILRHGNLLIFSFTLDDETSIERLETDGLLGVKGSRRLKPLPAITCAHKNKKKSFSGLFKASIHGL